MILQAVNELSPFIIIFYCIQWFCKQSMSFLRLSLCSIVFKDSVSSQWAFSVYHYLLLYSMILYAVNELSPFIIMFYSIQWFCKQSMSFLRLSLCSILFKDSVSSQWAYLFIITFYCIQWFCKQSMSFLCSSLRCTRVLQKVLSLGSDYFSATF